ncbi:hypothetical protein G5B30_14415 [Sphingobacterium sp. SGG-5]|uniref:hypothetical protein n=1 Tax=Sphingobacterium sp. SGG-5 TaxID=2710881 RepID=UPI0013EC48A9|nr:hypothetical protein [Sphingobacterium sp. SGG-5]NGM63101.1 hypothetical protein [Sphingobacterium sp. SGG-5]
MMKTKSTRNVFAVLTVLVISLFFSGCGRKSDPIVVDENPTTGTGDKIEDDTDDGYLVVVVSDQQKQQLRFGVDAERLWFWRSGNKDELAKAAVGDMQSDYVRVAINAAYEREYGNKNESAYHEILEMMTAMRAANPNIKFFASPRPLHEAYNSQEAADVWGPGNTPWSPFPAWIQQWRQDGTAVRDGITVPKWVKSYFDSDAWVQYYADYLNFMHDKGFDIAYMDVTNEQTIITPALTKYLYENMPAKLNIGVQMPLLVTPSSWNTQGGINWLDAVDQSKGEHLVFAVAASHNTGEGGSLEEFVAKATQLGAEPWNSELHGWVGTDDLKQEIMTSTVFWEHLRAGYSGIDTWLFFGSLAGRPHSMINSNGVIIEKAGKYEIFKQVVNNANRGYYVDIPCPTEESITAAFIKDKVLSIWILNRGQDKIESVKFRMPGHGDFESKVEVIKWQEDLPKSGDEYDVNMATSTSFVTDIEGESLYFFKLNIK